MRNVAMCTSELIAFCDQDDIWRPNKLQRAAAAFDQADLLFYSNAQLVEGAGNRLGPAILAKAPPMDPPSSLHPYSWGRGFLLVFRRWLLRFEHLWGGFVGCSRARKADGTRHVIFVSDR